MLIEVVSVLVGLTIFLFILFSSFIIAIGLGLMAGMLWFGIMIFIFMIRALIKLRGLKKKWA